MERVLLKFFCVLDSPQFAYKSDRGTDNAVLTQSKSSLHFLKDTRVLFIDFSAAFNYEARYSPERLADLNIDKLILWIRDFLSCCPKGSV